MHYIFFHFFFITIFVAVICVLDNTAFFKQIKDAIFDKIMFLHSDFAPTLADSQDMQRMVLFDVDEQSYRAWDSPLITPRDKLEALIQTAIDRGAKVIGVDMTLLGVGSLHYWFVKMIRTFKNQQISK